MKPELFDVVIVGAGPAGMGAALEASRAGLSVALLDEQEQIGGQIYRNITQATPNRHTLLGPDYAAGAALARAFTQAPIAYLAGASVWQITPERTVHFLKDGMARVFSAGRIILCSGAYERPMPIPGWTLPGVMTAGAGQILIKGAALVPRHPVVLAGCGPLLYLLAWQYLQAGQSIAALVDTTTRQDELRAGRQLLRVLLSSPGRKQLAKGAGLLRAIRQAGVPHFRGARNLAVVGETVAEALTFSVNEQRYRIPARLVLLHQGIVPNTQFTQALRAEHHWDKTQLCWTPVTDQWGELSVPGIHVAGDGGGIVGATAAGLQGRLAALGAAVRLERFSLKSAGSRIGQLRQELKHQLSIRPFLDTLYRPLDALRVPPEDDVIVCRCEEVRAGDLRRYVALGCQGPNQAKSFGRCGMGPCQGRLCGLTVSETIAQARGVSPVEVGYCRIRPPIKPITLAELATER